MAAGTRGLVVCGEKEVRLVASSNACGVSIMIGDKTMEGTIDKIAIIVIIATILTAAN